MNRFKADWEQTRQLMWACMAPHQKKGSNLTPQKLMPFPWEKDADIVQKEELEALKAQVEKQQEWWAGKTVKKVEA